MYTQPRILIVLVATADIVKTYNTIRSVQALNYRNFDFVCVVPAHLKQLKKNLATDFIWLPIIHNLGMSVKEQVRMAIDRGTSYGASSILFLMPGTKLPANFLKSMVVDYHQHTSPAIFFPVVERPDGSQIYGATGNNVKPYQHSSITKPLTRIDFEEDAHFAGGAALIRLSTCRKVAIPDVSEESYLLFWIEKMIKGGARTVTLYKHQLFYDGFLYSNLFEQTQLPENFYYDLKDMVAKQAGWYDRLSFWYQITIRQEELAPRHGSQMTADESLIKG